MTRTVKCVVLGAEAEGLERVPYPGELGKRIYENVSKLAWQRWLKHQTMLINEYRLSPIEPKARAFLEKPARFLRCLARRAATLSAHAAGRRRAFRDDEGSLSCVSSRSNTDPIGSKRCCSSSRASLASTRARLW